MSKLHEVQEFHRGKWIPIMVKDKDGKERPKTVRILEAHAEEMSRSTIAEVDEKRFSNGFRYVLISEETKIEDMKAAELKAILDEKGIEYKGNSSKADLIELINSAE